MGTAMAVAPAGRGANSKLARGNGGLSARFGGQKGVRGRQVQCAVGGGTSLPDGLLFDCDGVIAETERDGHRVSFNEAFKEKGLPVEWTVEHYGELLRIGGGKERMKHDFEQNPDREPFSSVRGNEDRWELLKELHALKTDKFLELVEGARLPLRPGVERLMSEAHNAGIPVAVCSTSNERAVKGIVRGMLREPLASSVRVFAGDVVENKKPRPDIYILASCALHLDPAKCVVVEDSRIGVDAAKAAGMRCVVTKSVYTAEEDFSPADAVLDTLGEDGDPKVSLGDLSFPGRFWGSPEEQKSS